MAICHIGPKQRYAGRKSVWFPHPHGLTGPTKRVGIAEGRSASTVEGGCGHSGKGESQRPLSLQAVPRAEGVSSAPQCPTRTPVHCRMDGPDLLARAVEHLLHAAPLSGPEPAKTLPVYDSASHADPSEGENTQVRLTSVFRSPDGQTFQYRSIRSILVCWASLASGGLQLFYIFENGRSGRSRINGTREQRDPSGLLERATWSPAPHPHGSTFQILLCSGRCCFCRGIRMGKLLASTPPTLLEGRVPLINNEEKISTQPGKPRQAEFLCLIAPVKQPCRH